MAKKITIQHLYTTGTTAAPDKDALTLGEIAISAGKGREGIYFKNNNNEVVKVPTSTEIQNTISNLDGNGFTYKALSGESPKFHIGTGTGIEVTTDAVSISTDYINKITGATPLSTFNAHTGNTTVHITGEERTNWNNAANRINTFLDVETGATEALDSLHEIQEYLTGSGNSVTTLLESLSDLTDTVDSNTTAITQNSNNISNLIISATTNANNIKTLGQTIGQVSTNVTTINNTIGTGFTPQNTITSEIESIKSAQSSFVSNIFGDNKNIQVNKDATNRYTITHASASTQTNTITATNDTTGLSFGSEFKIVDKIGYDANGHVVSGSTQTLKLPTVSIASDLVAGITTLRGGDLSTITNVVNGQAAASYHIHNQYVKFTDLSNNPNSDSIIISCGTY